MVIWFILVPPSPCMKENVGDTGSGKHLSKSTINILQEVP